MIHNFLPSHYRQIEMCKGITFTISTFVMTYSISIACN